MKKFNLLPLILLTLFFGCEVSEESPDSEQTAESLFQLYDEPAGTNCANGGLLLETGLDDNQNGLLDANEVTKSEFICNEENTVEQIDYYFQQGFKDYEDAIGLSISSEEQDTSISDLICSINTFSEDTSRVLLKFGQLSQIISEDFESSSIYLNEAILYLHTNCIGNNSNYLEVGTFDVVDPSVPTFDQNATWNQANNSDLWTSPGSFTDINQNELTFGGFDDRFYFEGGGAYLGSWIPLRLSREAVSRWITNEANNKGLVLSLGMDPMGDICFDAVTSNSNERGPMLYLNVEKAPSGERDAPKTEEQLKSEWDLKTTTEKLAPLYRLLHSKD